MRAWLAVLGLGVVGFVAPAASQVLAPGPDLRIRVERHFDVLAITGGVALEPRGWPTEIRMIELRGDTVAVDGVVVTPEEARRRLGPAADLVLELSGLPPDSRRALFGLGSEDREPAPPPAGDSRPVTVERADGPPEPKRMRSRGRVRIGGSVLVGEDEALDGDVVAILGTARVLGSVRGDVVAVLGDVELGERAVVRGTVVAVMGRVRKDPGAEVRGDILDAGAIPPAPIDVGAIRSWAPGRGVLAWMTLLATLTRIVILAALALVIALVAPRFSSRMADAAAADPFRAGLVGIAAQVVFLPLLVAVTVVLVLSLVGIVLLPLVPVAAAFFVGVVVAGFAVSAYALGRAWLGGRGREPGAVPSILLGVVVLTGVTLLARLAWVAGGAFWGVALVLVGLGALVEFLGWSVGLGALLLSWWASRRGRVAGTGAGPAPAPPVAS